MNLHVAGIAVDELCKFGKPKEIATRRGPRILRSAKPTPEFWDAWNANKSALQAAGIGVSKHPQTDEWQVGWWAELPREELENRAVSIEQSRAIDSTIEIPVPDGCELRAFQKAGVQYALARPATLIADEMGLGKTPTSICFINCVPEISRVLVICPLTIKNNWHRELSKWLTRKMSIGFADAKSFPSTDIVIIHYNILHKWPKKLCNYWDLLIADECHRIKIARSRQTRCVVGWKPTRKELANGAVPISGIPAKRKLFLSGTPFENKPAELFPIVNYLAPEKFPSRWKFEGRFCGAQNNGFGYEANGATHLDELSALLRSSVMIRRLKKDVLSELPPKIRQIIELDTKGLEQFINAEKKAWSQNEDALTQAQADLEIAKASGDEEQFKVAVNHLKQKSGLIFGELAKVRHDTALASVPQAIELLRAELEEMEKQKLVVFFHHRDVGLALAKEFGNECVMITGETPQEERDGLVQRFQNDDKIKLFLGSIRATGEGITLTAASTVFFIENDWTASRMAQCSDRCHRIGQKDNVLVKYLIVPGTISAYMIKTWISKEEVFEKAMDSDKDDLKKEATLMPQHESLGTCRQIRIEKSIIDDAQRLAIHNFVKKLSVGNYRAQHLTPVEAKIIDDFSQRKFLTNGECVIARKVILRHKQYLGDTRACGGWQGNLEQKEL